MSKILADRTSAIDASGIRKVFALARQLEDPINFSIGQPDFDVPAEIKASAIAAIQGGANKYSQTAGDEALLAKVGEHIEREYGWDDAGVLITSGVSGALLLTFMAIVNPGDEVVLVDPYFVIYKQLINLVGGRCVFVENYPDFRLPVAGIAAALSEKTKLIILNSPANPTGAVYSDADVRAVAELACEHGIVVMSDEIYEAFCYEGKAASIGHYYDRVLLLKGFSKSYGMTGWRLGYVACNAAVGEVVEAMTKIQQYTYVCAPTPFQKAAITAMDYDVSEYVARYRKKRDMIYAGLRDKFEIVRPGGAFYVFVKAPAWAKTATEFVARAIANNVLIIPGSVFSEKDTHFRISYATSDEKIEEGIEVLCKLAQSG
jgi:aspartate aminotransferase/aminotransferase